MAQCPQTCCYARCHAWLCAPQELFAALAGGWQSLDCINLSTAFYRLGQFAEATAGGPSAFQREQLLGQGAWCWLLDQLPAAAQAPEFGGQCVSNTLAALCRLNALSPSLLHALHAPLLRALQGATGCGSAAGSVGYAAAGAPAAAAGLDTRGLSQVMWAFGNDRNLKPLLRAVKPQLFGALWAAAPDLDAQVGAGPQLQLAC
jgi:hypothetical protein